jgi:pimeloyl-ACP methyl ester carboxylesterase
VPEKYVRRDGLPLLLRHSGPTTLPQDPPRRGGGPAIVCLHDAGLQSSFFSELLAALDDRLGDEGLALAFDLPGHGRSGGLDSLPTIGAMAEMARWIVDWCRIERPLLVGHGMGALIALEWARSPSTPIAGLILCGVGLALGIDEPAIERMRRVSQGKAPRPFDPARLAPGASPDLMRHAYMEGIRTDPRATLVDLEASFAWTEEALGANAADDTGDRFALDRARHDRPVRVLVGDAEPADDRTRAEALVTRLEGAELGTIAQAAHLLPLEQPGALADEILSSMGAGPGAAS